MLSQLKMTKEIKTEAIKEKMKDELKKRKVEILKKIHPKYFSKPGQQFL